MSLKLKSCLGLETTKRQTAGVLENKPDEKVKQTANGITCWSKISNSCAGSLLFVRLLDLFSKDATSSKIEEEEEEDEAEAHLKS